MTFPAYRAGSARDRNMQNEYPLENLGWPSLSVLVVPVGYGSVINFRFARIFVFDQAVSSLRELMSICPHPPTLQGIIYPVTVRGSEQPQRPVANGWPFVGDPEHWCFVRNVIACSHHNIDMLSANHPKRVYQLATSSVIPPARLSIVTKTLMGQFKWALEFPTEPYQTLCVPCNRTSIRGFSRLTL